ncbi:hypothetical protein [Bradyrhizobium sp. 45]|uniref:hypothetical protein n=1 Tax=Bradyrhizobium sp. 45 TaxID=1043587 RepID=UPI001FFB4013|nr:hypothetical protein [Bradyrhizobium sp. 45]MCK1306506.1 hypothetical protein [Bradyrhizobium sp. 45]
MPSQFATNWRRGSYPDSVKNSTLAQGASTADKLMAIDRRPRTRWQISAMRLGPDGRQKIVSPLNNQA